MFSFLKAFPLRRGAICVSKWLVISTPPLSVAENQPVPKQLSDNVHSQLFYYIKQCETELTVS